ncbi:MAG: modulator of FtsH protease [Myxococcota bacterium]|jgi:modulator of FtsH protease
MSNALAAIPLRNAPQEARVTYLKRVMLWTTGGLTIAAIVGSLTAVALYLGLAAGMTFLMSTPVMLVGIMGSFAIAQWVAPKLVFGEQKVFGFLLAATFEGIAFGWLLLSAVMLGLQTGNPFGLIFSALGLTGLTGAGLTAYVWSNPKEFKLLGAALSALFVPMLILMGVSFIFPGLFGGPLGIALSALFVVISAGGLLYQINTVLHKLRTDMHMEGSYLITMGILVLYWNILTLLMHLGRD